MYCPTCAAQNVDNAQFCRACGADISFLSQAMTRPEPEEEKRREQASAILFHRRRLSGAGADHVVRGASSGKLGHLLLNALRRISIARYRYRNGSFCQEIRIGPRIGHR